jgi:hypothetical protein
VSFHNRLARLKRLERAQVSPGRCPECPPLTFVEVDEAGKLLPGSPPWPEPCRRCGGPHDGSIQFIEVVLRREAGDDGDEGPE